MDIKYEARGICLGNYWGGGSGSYKANNYSDLNLDELKDTIKNAIKDGSIDSGMGFESIRGAMMAICTIRTIIHTVDGEELEFTNNQYDIECFGDLTEEEQDFLLDVYYCTN